jgi:hypothetical protein
VVVNVIHAQPSNIVTAAMIQKSMLGKGKKTRFARCHTRLVIFQR